MGKTAVVLNIAVNASEHHTVALFEQEMSNVQLGKRILASESLTSHDNIKKGNLTSDEFNDLKDTVKRLENYKLFVDETSGQSVNEIKAKCKRLKIKEGLDVVIIDYIQLLAGDSKSENRVQELTKISRALKVLAKELDVAVIALAQLSRAPEIRQEHRPMLADLRESGSIEQDADVVIMLYRDEYYNQNTDSKGTMEIIITKNRNGELGTIKMEWASQFQRVAPQFK
jgi:replicative DNA helicase